MGDIQENSQTPLYNLRERIIDQLKDGYAHGLLAEEEFEHLLEQATNAQSKQELTLLSQQAPTVPNSSSAVRSHSLTINEGPIKQEDTFACVFSGTTRKGVWKPAQKINSLVVFGGSDLDFTRAEIPPNGLEIDLLCIFGGIDIIVPEGLNVDASGFAIFGGFDDKSDGMVDKESPVLKIRGFVAFGGVDIKVRRRGKGKKKSRR